MEPLCYLYRKSDETHDIADDAASATATATSVILSVLVVVIEDDAPVP